MMSLLKEFKLKLITLGVGLLCLIIIKFLFAGAFFFSVKVGVLALITLIITEFINAGIIFLLRSKDQLWIGIAKSYYTVPTIVGLRAVQLFLNKADLIIWTSIDIYFLLMLLFFIIQLSLLRRDKWCLISGLAFILFITVIPQSYFSYYRKVFMLSDMANYFLLYKVLSFSGIAVIFSITILVLSAIGYLLVVLARFHKKLLVFLTVTILAVLILGYQKLTWLENKAMERGKIVAWSEHVTCNKLGIFPSLLYYELKRRQNQSKIAAFKNQKFSFESTALYKDLQGAPRINIHLVLLESWVNFGAWEGPGPLVEDPSIFFQGTRTKTRAFGGGTATAEFEVLCGVPGLGLLSSIDFNSMQGHPTACLPQILSKLGYQTILSNVWEPLFFNSQNAYTSMGFKEQHFHCPNCHHSYIAKFPDKGDLIFDGDLYRANIKFLEERILKKQAPLFNYVVGGYGHIPFQRNFELRPDLYENNEISKPLLRSVNQYLYRKKAMEEFVKKLSGIDPESLIILYGDHLPNIENAELYKKHNYLGSGDFKLTETFIIYRGRHLRFNQIEQFQLPYLIADILQGKVACKPWPCRYTPRKISETDYKRILAGSMLEGVFY